MDERYSKENSTSANTLTSAIIPTELEVHGAVASSRKFYLYTFVRIVLGLLLLSTASLKLFNPSLDNFRSSGLQLLSSQRWQIAAIEVEALLGLWLLSGALPRLLWMTALLCFSLLGCASLYLGIEGQSSCGCLGAKFPISPWYALGLDLVAIASLIWSYPRHQYRSDSTVLRRILAVAAGTGVILVVGLGVLAWSYGSPYEGLLHFQGESIAVDPSMSQVGEGVEGECRTFTLQLSNRRDKPIEVIGGTATCPCIATDDLPIVVPPNGSVSIRVRIWFRGKPGSFQHSFVLYTDDERQPKIVARFAGRVIALPSP